MGFLSKHPIPYKRAANQKIDSSLSNYLLVFASKAPTA